MNGNPVGAIGYDCKSGISNLMKDFYDNGVVDYVLIIPHPHYPRYPERYSQDRRFQYQDWGLFLNRISTLLLFENAFRWDIVAEARKRGIRICLIPNYEYTPFPPPVVPDLIICASLLDVEYYKGFPHTFLPIPVHQEWRQRTRALEFIHNAGHGQRGFAKGTPQIIEAMEYVKSEVRLLITGQPGERRIQELFAKHKHNPRVTLEYGDKDPSELYSRGDVFINAEQYNGMSLMLQEAYAAGMLVMTTDRFPMNTWLPKEPLIPVDYYVKDRIAVEFERAIVEPRAIAEKIDEWYGRDISAFSLSGKEWAEETSWKQLKPRYMELLKA